MRHASGGFSPPWNRDRRSSRLSIGGLAERSVRVVITAAISVAAESAPALPAYGFYRRAYCQSPTAAIHADTAASAAVSARRIRGPRLIGLELGVSRIA